MRDDFWTYLDRIVSESILTIDRPKGSHHPRHLDLVYPLDYGYLEGTTAGDGGGIDIWLGSSSKDDISAILLTIDLSKRDAEIKILLRCTEDDLQTALNFLNRGTMRATLIRRPSNERS